MNEEARAELDRIVAIEPAALTDSDRAFLSARRDYLSEDQKATFAEILSENQHSMDSKQDYNKLTKSELQSVLQKREIAFEDSYTKAVLIAMLGSQIME